MDAKLTSQGSAPTTRRCKDETTWSPRINQQVKTILDSYSVSRYPRVNHAVREEHLFRQARRSGPGPTTAYRKITERRFDIEWSTDEEAIAFDHKKDWIVTH
jgi:hypothetical protein